MKLKFTSLIALVLIGLTLSNCQKKKGQTPVEDEPATTATTTSTVNTLTDLFATNGSQPQTVTVSAIAASTIVVNGVTIEIPANAFVTTSTGTVVSGVVSLTVKTVLTPAEIILTGAGANSSNSRLVSTKGCVKVTASQNSQSLRLGGGGNFFVSVPDGVTAPAPMKKWYAPKVTAVDSTAFWALGTDVSPIPTFFDGAKYQHRASLDSLKWLNVGVQYDSIGAPKAAVTVSLTSTLFNKTNTAIYLKLNGSLTIGALFEISPSVFRISNMPIGKGVTIVAVGVNNGQYFSGVQTMLVPSSTTPINLGLAPCSLAQMQANLSALP